MCAVLALPRKSADLGKIPLDPRIAQVGNPPLLAVLIEREADGKPTDNRQKEREKTRGGGGSSCALSQPSMVLRAATEG